MAPAPAARKRSSGSAPAATSHGAPCRPASAPARLAPAPPARSNRETRSRRDARRGANSPPSPDHLQAHHRYVRVRPDRGLRRAKPAADELIVARGPGITPHVVGRHHRRGQRRQRRRPPPGTISRSIRASAARSASSGSGASRNAGAAGTGSGDAHLAHSSDGCRVNIQPLFDALGIQENTSSALADDLRTRIDELQGPLREAETPLPAPPHAFPRDPRLRAVTHGLGYAQRLRPRAGGGASWPFRRPYVCPRATGLDLLHQEELHVLRPRSLGARGVEDEPSAGGDGDL